MLKLSRAILGVAAAGALLVPAAPAHGASSAQRFADAAERGKSAIRASRGEIEKAIEASGIGDCEGLIERRPPRGAEIERLANFVTAATFQPLFVATLPVLQQLVADLEAIPTADPALRSGRAVWRVTVAELAAYPTTDRPCEQLERWAASGWRKSGRPDFDFAAAERLFEQDASGSRDRKLARAARRMLVLGVSEGDALRFTGDSMFDEVEELLDEGPLGAVDAE